MPPYAFHLKAFLSAVKMHKKRFISGPCSLNEAFFPQSGSSSKGIGSCFLINHNGQTRFHETNQVCLDSSSRGSLQSSFNPRDQEFGLLKGVLDYLYLTSDPNERLKRFSTDILVIALKLRAIKHHCFASANLIIIFCSMTLP